MKISHTPGKWNYHSGSVYSENDTPIAHMERDTNKARDIAPWERDANARLIALVPEMLEVCRKVIASESRLYGEKSIHYHMATEIILQIEKGNN